MGEDVHLEKLNCINGELKEEKQQIQHLKKVR